ncbi:endonuclease domain-containing 1 protein-like protein [Lates japonicus]|uniref:Endonuclease domain-containing 1 protein-like protein n=1 Tax=Lates japonicus TaxID=270547 RepID=A0AAD3RFS5_LATJO|nr:endonuclease domain-containing 1 protein-like protein [Lates japonicus]
MCRPQGLNEEYLTRELCEFRAFICSEISSGDQRGGKLLVMSQRKMLRFSAGVLLLLLPWFGGLRLGSNNGPWNVLENEVLGRLAHCTGEMYVITGAIPYKTESEFKKHWLKDKDGKDRVAIPEYMWSAYCCPNHTPNTQFFPTYAAVGRNDPDSNNDIVTKDPNVPNRRGLPV